MSGILRSRASQSVERGETARPPTPRFSARTASAPPLWLISLYAVALFFGAFYIGRYSGSFNGNSLDPIAGQQLADNSAIAVPSTQPVPDLSKPASVQVMIRNMQFSPATVEIKKGDIVEWKNDDLTPHTATSMLFDSGSIEPEKSWRHKFTDAGSFPYACTFHPDMKASVVVKER